MNQMLETLLSKIKIRHIISLIIGLFILILDITFLIGTRWVYTVLIIGLSIAALPFFLDFLKENKKQKEIENMFLEFSRALVESVKSGIPIPQSIGIISKNDFGALSPYLKKLANQIEWGISIRQALTSLGKDTKNLTIQRAVAIVIQAEQSGGRMDDVLESVTKSIQSIKELKDERKSTIFSQTVEGYIVFYIFVIIMLVLQVKFLPKIQEMSASISGTGVGGLLGDGAATTNLNMKLVLLELITIQGIFAGLMIGKFSEGKVIFGVKHSVILVISSLLIILTVSPI